ncbi:ABC transporter permease [Nocardioides sp. Kera G14]|uniref:ABC transporter permease n=1 Tax=Nocardioides sp. Kera G14 TaxID=2884264 RepID=UPI001D111F12|nr:ABC transporter permease subunit [Nocardioides sp. Kera G14]UDY25093.1 ABC transporter permease subunit [Nocardioides sp. Kera G14]
MKGRLAVRIGSTIGLVALSMGVLALAWQVAVSWLISSGHTNSYIAKKPADVWDYFFATGMDKVPPSEHRHDMLQLLWVTLGHTALGFAAGVIGSVVLALLFALVRPLEFMFLPVAMVLRTVPLLAMAPAIYLIFGNGLVAAALISSIVVFFPILLNLAVGFRSVSPTAVDFVRVHGGSRWTILRKVAMPTALPQLFASMRIAIPGAITGAMLYEWLLTSKGLGGSITLAKAHADYQEIWAIVVVVTVTSILLYTIASLVEDAVLARWGFTTTRR